MLIVGNRVKMERNRTGRVRWYTMKRRSDDFWVILIS